MKRYLPIGLLLLSGCGLLFNPQPAPGPGPAPDPVVVVPDDGVPDTHKQRAALTAAAKTLKVEDAIALYGPYVVIADALRKDSTQFQNVGTVVDRLGALIEALKLDLNGFSKMAEAIDAAQKLYSLDRPQLVSDKRADLIEIHNLIATALKDAAEGK